MNYKESLDYLSDLSKRGYVLGLDNMVRALELLGHPEKSYHCIHIAGTNGKGSTSTLIAQTLIYSSYRTGLFTSPQVGDYTARITIDGEAIDQAKVASVMSHLKRICEEADIPITEFEMTTLLAFQAFAEAECDFVVLEVGMGGRLDATNAILSPEAFAITRIGLDHTQWLGQDIKEIAQEKAGIIKRGSRGVLYPACDQVQEVILRVCEKETVPIEIAQRPEIIWADQRGTQFAYRDTVYTMGMIGRHQAQNAAIVIDLVNILMQRGHRIPFSALDKSLRETRLEGRCEILSVSPIQVIDASHNPQGLQALFDTLSEVFPGKTWTGIFGVLADKDVNQMLDIMSNHIKSLYCIQSKNPRALNVHSLAQMTKLHGMKVEACYDTINAIESDLNHIARIDGLLVFGSFHHALPIRQMLIEALGGGYAKSL